MERSEEEMEGSEEEKEGSEEEMVGLVGGGKNGACWCLS